jgi:hypothetical protein
MLSDDMKGTTINIGAQDCGITRQLLRKCVMYFATWDFSQELSNIWLFSRTVTQPRPKLEVLVQQSAKYHALIAEELLATSTV